MPRGPIVNGELFDKAMLNKLCTKLISGKEIEIDGVRFKSVKANLENPTKSPCWSCTTKFGYSRKICQVCIHLDNIYFFKYHSSDRHCLTECNYV